MTQMNLINIHRTFHPNTEEYTFSTPYGNFSKTNQTLSHKANLNSYFKNAKYSTKYWQPKPKTHKKIIHHDQVGFIPEM